MDIRGSQIKQERGVDYILFTDYLHFRQNGTGYRLKRNKLIVHIDKKSLKADEDEHTMYVYELAIPFTYSLQQDDIGNLAIVKYGKGKIVSKKPRKSELVTNAAQKDMQGSEDMEVKFYWHINQDSVYKTKALQFIEPGESFMRSYKIETPTWKYE